ncbi:MAG TPA: CerR family C-terminal domain-containing protein [Verrucomicrobiae bacterium]|nr:CerR family C-terminal domain-containing protein [Verrucomicrobiae bacterium]
MSLTSPSPPITDLPTREQVLEVASEIFAEAGYRSATIREICHRARVNVAAINYHFGDKQALYLEVLQRAHRLSITQYPVDLGLPSNAIPEQRLAAFIRSFLLRIFSSGPGARHGKLMAREMINPTGALDTVVRDNIQPMAANLLQILRDLLGPEVPVETARLCAMSVVSQVLFYHHCRPVVSRMFPALKFGPEDIEQLATHITRFSLAAIRQLAKSAPAPDGTGIPRPKLNPRAKWRRA